MIPGAAGSSIDDSAPRSHRPSGADQLSRPGRGSAVQVVGPPETRRIVLRTPDALELPVRAWMTCILIVPSTPAFVERVPQFGLAPVGRCRQRRRPCRTGSDALGQKPRRGRPRMLARTEDQFAAPLHVLICSDSPRRSRRPRSASAGRAGNARQTILEAGPSHRLSLDRSWTSRLCRAEVARQGFQGPTRCDDPARIRSRPRSRAIVPASSIARRSPSSIGPRLGSTAARRIPALHAGVGSSVFRLGADRRFRGPAYAVMDGLAERPGPRGWPI